MTSVVQDEGASSDWRGDLARAFGGLVTDPIEDAFLTGALHGAAVADVGVYTVSGGPQVVRRTPRAIRDQPADPLKMCLQLDGRAIVHQAGKEIVIDPGRLAVYDTGRPYDLRLEGSWSCAVLAVPHAALDVSRHVLDESMEHALLADHGPGAVLAAFVASAAAAAAGAGLSPSSAARVAEASLHLLAGTLNDGFVGWDDDVAGARRIEILGYVRRHLGDHDLSPGSVADAHHVSPRTLHRLFAEQPMSVNEYIREQRLRAAHRDLEDPVQARHGVAGIAARWCFVDQAHFTRTFKTRFGVTPGLLRPRPDLATAKD